jgi:secreted Zn-dependent insulinase-like peptidase
VLCHAPRLKRCAASLRVAAGSHDVAAAWPGLAHFLEHLFFLGTEQFADDEKLMTFVQRHGGQINASTRERTTDFFFELPEPVFAQGLERLCDMLAHPRMTLPDQLREREVLHAEFIAWSRDAAAREQLQMLAGLSARHPLRAFHAGNRYSLQVPNQAFQHALQDFYQRFYQAGQMTLCLAGPQALTELQALAATYGAYIASGVKAPQEHPPKLVDDKQNQLISTDHQLLLACEDLPAGADEAAAFLCHCLNGSWVDGAVEPFKAEVVYQFTGQILIKVKAGIVSGSTLASTLTPTDLAVTQNWLSVFNSRWPSLRDDYNRLEQRRRDVCGPLELAHYHARNLPQGLSEQGSVALVALMEQLQAPPLVAEINWQLPKPNPFLQAPGYGSEGAIYLRWRLPSAQPALRQMLDRSLKSLGEDASQAGSNLEFTAYGNYWQLKLSGIDAPMPDVLKHALRLLSEPDDAAMARTGQPNEEPALIPIRQLLKALPDACLNAAHANNEANDIHTLWPKTQWTSFISGLAPDAVQKVNTIMGSTPGMRDQQPLHAALLAPGRHWRSVTAPSSESAVLLFCPVPTASIADEAAWRLLAQLAQGPFYQRLRVELQLGYAVFSGLRQIAGQVAILFGVQSPSTTVPQLLGHIETFLQTLPERMNDADLPAQAHTLIAQLDINAMAAPQAAELGWQAHLAGRDDHYLPALKETLRNMNRHSMLQAVANLQAAAGGWLCLTNRPENPWPADGSLPKL